MPEPLSPATAQYNLSDPVLPRLLRFNLLPSLELHPAQIETLSPPAGLDRPQAPVRMALHRRWSERLLRHLGNSAAPVINRSEPALPLAIAMPQLLERLVRDLGIALLGQALRRVVLRQEVQQARAELGLEGMNWALDGAKALHPGLPEVRNWLSQGWAVAADLLGSGLLAQAWHDAPSSLQKRANWRLHPLASTPELRTASELEPIDARALGLKLLREKDPAWLSCFPAIP